MRIRDLLLAFLIPIILLGSFYLYARGPKIYHPENAVKKMRTGENLTIVFFGDSITSGYGEGKNFVYQFRVRLKGTTAFDRTRIYNTGIPGDTSTEGLRRLKQDVIDLKPDLVYIAFGGNDMKNKIPLPDFENNLRTMVGEIRHSVNAEVILMTMPIFDIPLIQSAIKQYNHVIRKVAKETGVGCLDIYKTWRKEIGWFGSSTQYMQPDHIHPNEKGHLLIYQDIWRTLE